MSMIKIFEQEVLQWCKEYDGPPFMALLCDPPYHLSGGFMGKKWDKDGPDAIAFKPETWAALAEHLLPGAFGMAFASSRGWHRLACAIEDAGLIIHPSIFGYSYGSGFPKATRVDIQIDKSDAVVEKKTREYRFTEWMRNSGITARQINKITSTNMGNHYLSAKSQPAIATSEIFDKLRQFLPPIPVWVEEYVKQRTIESKQFAKRKIIGKTNGAATSNTDSLGKFASEYLATMPATNIARAWAGHRYGLQAMKPALEPIIVFQKPYEGKPVDSITKTGAGALNIDKARIGTKNNLNGGAYSGEQRRRSEYSSTDSSSDAIQFSRLNRGVGEFVQPQCRWPANFVLVHDPSCNGECVPGCAVRKFGEQSGESTSTDKPRNNSRGVLKFGGQNLRPSSDDGTINIPSGFSDSGTAARFFFNANWNAEVEERLLEVEPVRYQAKASRRERDAGLNELHDKKNVWGDGLNSATKIRTSTQSENGVDRGKCRNPHPTVKPMALTQWLATLLLPPVEYASRRILIPFSGSGSEIIGAHKAGWEEIIGIEMEAEYVKIAEARIAHHCEQKRAGQEALAL